MNRTKNCSALRTENLLLHHHIALALRSLRNNASRGPSFGRSSQFTRPTLQMIICSMLWLSLIAPETCSAESLALSNLSDYNALVFDTFEASGSDVEGSAAVGGSLMTTDYSFGAALDPDLAANSPVLVLSGNADLTRTRIYYGDFYHFGAGRLFNSQVDGRLRNESLLDFLALEQHYDTLSSELASLEPTGTAVAEFNQLRLTGESDSVFHVFTVTPDLWKDQNGGDVTVIDLEIPDGSTAIINVAGTEAELSAMGFADRVNDAGSPFRRNTLFNFFEANDVTLRNIGLEGSVLAPGATLVHEDGVVYGQVISDNFFGNGQVDLEPFEGLLAAPVPEPRSSCAAAWAIAWLLALRHARMRTSPHSPS